MEADSLDWTQCWEKELAEFMLWLQLPDSIQDKQLNTGKKLNMNRLTEQIKKKTKKAQAIFKSLSQIKIPTSRQRNQALGLKSKILKIQSCRLIAAGHEIVDFGYDTSTELETVFDFAESRIFGLTTGWRTQNNPRMRIVKH